MAGELIHSIGGMHQHWKNNVRNPAPTVKPQFSEFIDLTKVTETGIISDLFTCSAYISAFTRLHCSCSFIFLQDNISGGHFSITVKHQAASLHCVSVRIPLQHTLCVRAE